MSGYMVARIKKIMPNLVENMILRISHVVEKLWFEFINIRYPNFSVNVLWYLIAIIFTDKIVQKLFMK